MLNVNDNGVFPMLAKNEINLITLITSLFKGHNGITIRKIDNGTSEMAEIWRTLVTIVPNITARIIDLDTVDVHLTEKDINIPSTTPIDFQYLKDTKVQAEYNTKDVTPEMTDRAVIIHDPSSLTNILHALLVCYPNINRSTIFLPNWEEGQSLELLTKVLDSNPTPLDTPGMFSVNMIPFIGRWKGQTPGRFLLPLETAMDIMMPNRYPMPCWTAQKPTNNIPNHILANTAVLEGQKLWLWNYND